MATKKGFNLYFIDPVTGKRKLAKTKEQNKIARQQQKEKLNKMKAEQKAMQLQGAIKLSQAKKTANPKLYQGKTVSPISGKLLTKEQRAKEQRKKQKPKTKRKWSKQQQKDFKIDLLNKSDGKAKQALNDLNAVGEFYNSIFNSANSEIKQILNNSVGFINSDSNFDDFYNEKYNEVMLPNMTKEIKVYQSKLERGLESLYDYAKNLYGDELDDLENVIDKMKIAIEICQQSRTEYQRQILIAGEEEPEQPQNLHLSGL